MNKPTLKELREYTEVNACMVDKKKNPDGWHLYHVIKLMLDHLEEAEQEKKKYSINGVQLTEKQYYDKSGKTDKYVRNEMRKNKTNIRGYKVIAKCKDTTLDNLEDIKDALKGHAESKGYDILHTMVEVVECDDVIMFYLLDIS